MLHFDRWNEIFETLTRNKLRTFLTACGVFWGVFMLVVMLGFARGLEKGLRGVMGGHARNAIYIWPSPTTKPNKGHAPNRSVRLRAGDGALLARLPGVVAVAPRTVQRDWWATTSVSRGDKTEAFSVFGNVPEFFDMEPLVMDAGRFLNPLDMTEFRKVAVIGQRIQKSLFKEGEDPIGQTLRIRGVSFTVVGVFHSEVGGGNAHAADGRLFTPRSTFNRINGLGDRVTSFTLLVEDGVSSTAVEAQALAVLKARHHIHPDDPSGISSFNMENEYSKMTMFFVGLTWLSWFAGGMTLLAGAIGVGNILMISINERTKEFGVRKALGATPRSIIAQVVQEAILLTGLAGGLGLCVGVGALAAAQKLFESIPKSEGPSFFAPPDLDLPQALLAVLVLIVSGALAGLAPARTAVAITPREALATE